MTDDVRAAVANAIRAMRMERDLSHPELAARAHLDEAILWSLELAEIDVSIGVLGLLATGLDCSVEDLLGKHLPALQRDLIARVEQEASRLDQEAMTVPPEAQRHPRGMRFEVDPPSEGSQR